MKYLYVFLLLCLFAISCSKQDMRVIHEGSDDLTHLLNMENHLNLKFESYATVIPEYLKAVGMKDLEFDDDKVALGRVLFYDKALSSDQSVSCASCHQQHRAFADGKAFGDGVDGQRAARNSMALGNTTNFSAHYRAIRSNTAPSLLWDERVTNLQDLTRAALTNPREMGMTMPKVVERVKNKVYYQYLWKRAFGRTEIAEQDILDCISEFVSAIGSTTSKFDKALIQTSGEMSVTITDTIVSNIYYNPDPKPDTTIVTTTTLPFFNQSEFRGLGLFVANCSPCHSPIRPFQEVFMACNGLEMTYSDQGLGNVTGNPAHNGVFKSPPLRNIARTGPYMHDGRFKTLEEVVEFYSTGVVEHPNLHPRMRDENGSARKNFTAQQKKDIVAFLHTLTDDAIMFDERFSNPFK